MAVPIQKTSFASGEISPELFGHVDLAKFESSASTMRNLLVSYRGGAFSRGGTKYVGTSPQAYGTPPRLISWQFNISQGYVLEFGGPGTGGALGYIRFIFQGGYVLSGGVPYQINSPYFVGDLPLLKFSQSADVMTLTHPNYPPQDLSRAGPTSWSIGPTPVGAVALAAPTGLTATATAHPSTSTSPPTLPCAYAYVVTSVDSLTGEESIPTFTANVTDSVDMAVTAGSVILNWTPSVGPVAYYNIYRSPTCYNTQPGNTSNALPVPVGTLFGLVGQSFGSQFVDTNLIPDFSQTPPIFQDPFSPRRVLDIVMTGSSSDWTTATVSIPSSTGAGFFGQVVISNGEIVDVIIINPGHDWSPSDVPVFSGDGTSASGTLMLAPASGTYPGLVSYFQQRRFFADSLNQPDTYWASQPGAYGNFDISVPSEDTDSLQGTPWSLKVDGIQWMLTMPLGLLTFTGSGVQQIGAQGSFASSPQAITPTQQFAAPQSSIGCSATVPPLQINWDVLYVEPYNNNVLDLAYQIFFNIYAGTDISWPSSHLLLPYQLLQWCYCRSPYRVVWAVRNDGALLSLTYLKEQEIAGWARHDTQGLVRSICTVSESPVDALYMVVERWLPGGPVYLIERMDNRIWQTLEDSWCVDAGVATTLTKPSANLTVNSPSGAASFSATGAFSSGNVGNIIRMGGGIATITNYIDADTVDGVWNLPTPLVFPGTNAPIPATAGNWSIAQNVTSVGGLQHLANMQVVGLADGIPIGPLTVDGSGNVALPFPASNVVIGLAFTPQLQSVPLNAGQPTAQTRRKAIYTVAVRVYNSALCEVGSNQLDASTVPPATFVNWTNMTTPQIKYVRPAPRQPYTSPGGQMVQPLFSGDMLAHVQATFDKPGQVAVQQNLPLPLNVLLFVPEIQQGDLPEDALPPRQQRGEQR